MTYLQQRKMLKACRRRSALEAAIAHFRRGLRRDGTYASVSGWDVATRQWRQCFAWLLCWYCVSCTAFADLESDMRDMHDNGFADRACTMIANQDDKGLEILFKDLNYADPAVQQDCFNFVASGTWLPPKYARLALDCLLASQKSRYILEALDTIESDFPYLCSDKEKAVIQKLLKSEDAEVRKQAKRTLDAVEYAKRIDRNYFPVDGPWKHGR